MSVDMIERQALSKADRRRLRNEHLFRQAQEANAAKGVDTQLRGARIIDAKRGHYGREKTGVEWLREKGKLDADQAKMGKRYGEWWRGAHLAGAEAIRSCLDDTVRGGGTKGVGAADDTAAWIADCTAKVAACHAALSHVDYLVATLSAVAGKGATVASITSDPRKQVEIVTSLRTALDILLKTEREHGPF